MELSKLQEIAKREGFSRIVSNITRNYNTVIIKIIKSDLEDSMKDYLMKSVYDKFDRNLKESKISGSTLTHIKNYLYAVYRSNKLTVKEYS